MIVPALLTSNQDELLQMTSLCGTFCDFVQIDIMDGKFVPSSSVSLNDLANVSVPKRSEAHLMVCDPLAWVDAFSQLGSERILFHYEAEVDHKAVLEAIKAKGLQAGIAVNPGTTIEAFQGLVDELDAVLFMSVNPGFYGAPFIPEVLDKIKAFTSRYPRLRTGIDGGVKLDNVSLVKRSGVDYICVGSAILKQVNPAQAYQQFMETIHE